MIAKISVAIIVFGLITLAVITAVERVTGPNLAINRIETRGERRKKKR